jgi:hypothetical protein
MAVELAVMHGTAGRPAEVPQATVGGWWLSTQIRWGAVDELMGALGACGGDGGVHVP